MTLTEARNRIATLMPGDQITLDDERPFVISQREQSTLELHPPGCADIAGSYRRVSIETLASRIVAGEAVLP